VLSPRALRIALASVARGSRRMSDFALVPGVRLIPAMALGQPAEVSLAFRNVNRPSDLV